MTNSKSTKRALVTSALAILMCVAMLIGTTFAWFTDTASTGVNKIQAGNLKMEVSYKNTSDDEFKTLDENTNVFMENALWEPGHVEYAVLNVKNVGNLALKYKLGINIASETGSTNVNGKEFKLSDYIKFAVIDGEANVTDRTDLVAAAEAADSKLISAGSYSKENNLNKTNDADTVTLVVWMPTTVGNDANYDAAVAEAPVINLGINVVATQYTYEKDSFDDQYDKDAQYPVVVATDEEFKAALKQAKETKDMTIVLAKGTYGNIDVPVLKEGEKISGLTIIGEDGVEIGAFRIVSSADYLTVENLTLKNLTFTGEGFLDRTPTDGLTVSGCTFVGTATQFRTEIEPKKNVVIENCHFDNNGCADYFSSIYFTEGVEGLVIKNTTVENSGFNAISLQSGPYNGLSSGVITIEGNTMTNTGNRAIRMHGVAADAQITIKGNTMTNTKDSGTWFKGSNIENGATISLIDNIVDGGKYPNSNNVLADSSIAF